MDCIGRVQRSLITYCCSAGSELRLLRLYDLSFIIVGEFLVILLVIETTSDAYREDIIL